MKNGANRLVDESTTPTPTEVNEPPFADRYGCKKSVASIRERERVSIDEGEGIEIVMGDVRAYIIVNVHDGASITISAPYPRDSDGVSVGPEMAYQVYISTAAAHMWYLVEMKREICREKCVEEQSDVHVVCMVYYMSVYR